MPTKWKIYNLFTELNIGCHIENVQFIFSLHDNFKFHLEVRCTSLNRRFGLNFLWQCDFAWQSGVTIWLLIAQCLNNKKTWVFLLFNLLFHLNVLDTKIVSLNSRFYGFLLIHLNEYENCVSPHIEPLTVWNCSPWASTSHLRVLRFCSSWVWLTWSMFWFCRK